MSFILNLYQYETSINIKYKESVRDKAISNMPRKNCQLVGAVPMCNILATTYISMFNVQNSVAIDLTKNSYETTKKNYF